MFASPGRVDQPRSCAVRCKDGFFRVADGPCMAHATPTCAPGEFLRAGTPTRNAACRPCSGCAGRRRLAACNATADDACEECGTLREHQRWVSKDGKECELACEDGFELDTRTLKCELCTVQCAPGLLPPRARDNCTHCEACHPKPANSEWLTQDDRFNCAWECKPKHALVGDDCVSLNNVFEDAPTYTKLQPTCALGHTLVDFKCTPCFEAARLGAKSYSDLPQAADEGKTWVWISGCHWQCRNVLDYDKTPPEVSIYTPLRSENGNSWMCVQDRRRSLLLKGTDDSWITTRPLEAGALKTRTETVPARTSYALLILVAVPLLALKVSLLVHCLRRCKRDAMRT